MPSRTGLPLAAEISRSINLCRSLLSTYISWGEQVVWGETYLATYGDVIDFVNFRMETAETCLQMIEKKRIGDALGLCRSLLEYYLLFILICRGDKYFKVWDLSDKSSEEFKRLFDQQRAAWESERVEGTTSCIDIRRHPRARRQAILLYDGIVFDDGDRLPISMYFFHFDDFRPETMRLDSEDYFDYHEYDSELRKALKDHRREAEMKYRNFLSYDALLMGLELNGLIDDRARLRIEAHYTFLGKFVHPSKNAMRDLHEHSNWYGNKPTIGMPYPYKQSAELLASLYIAYLVAGILGEFAALIGRGSAKYVSEANVDDLLRHISSVPTELPYFWFVFNEAPLWERFNWAVNHATDEQLATYGGYARIPSELIPFDQNILGSLEQRLGGWNNSRVGSYRPPFGS